MLTPPTAPQSPQRGSAPNALLADHRASMSPLIAAVMSAKMDLPRESSTRRPIDRSDRAGRAAAAARADSRKPQPSRSRADRHVPIDRPDAAAADIDADPARPDPLPDLRRHRRTGVDPTARSADPTADRRSASAARFATPPSALKPPYPRAKLASERGGGAAAPPDDRRARPGGRGRAGRPRRSAPSSPPPAATSSRTGATSRRREDGRAVASTIVDHACASARRA